MEKLLVRKKSAKAVPISLVRAKDLKEWLKKQDTNTINWLKSLNFKAKPGSFCVVPGVKGKPVRVVVGVSNPVSMWDIAALPCPLPKGEYFLQGEEAVKHGRKLTLGWLIGTYRYTRYKKNEADPAKLVLPSGVDNTKIVRMAKTIAYVRDLINTPASDMGPEELAEEAVKAGKNFGAKVAQIVGENLLKKNYPGIYTVGKASTRTPRLVDIVWGNPKHKKITLIGKGVCFDSGGLDLKPSTAMLTMKKDMAGAAIALGLARLIMENNLPLRLRLLIPAVENVVSGNSYKPLDIITMRDGKTVEIMNTDAEGRLLLADLLVEAVKEKPSLIIDFSTLTGAARTALGTEISALFTNSDRLAEDLKKFGDEEEDPIWRLPLYAPYESMLESKTADIASAANSPYAGAITAALFLQRFVGKKQLWAHLDFMAWNTVSKPGRPEGGEASGLRAVYRLIEKIAETQ